MSIVGSTNSSPLSHDRHLFRGFGGNKDAYQAVMRTTDLSSAASSLHTYVLPTGAVCPLRKLMSIYLGALTPPIAVRSSSDALEAQRYRILCLYMGCCSSICSCPRPELEAHDIADRMDQRHHSFAETTKIPHRVHMRALLRSTTSAFSIFASMTERCWNGQLDCCRMSASLSKAGTNLLAEASRPVRLSSQTRHIRA